MIVVADKKPRRTGVPLQVYVPHRYKELLERMAARGRRPVTSELLLALEMYFKAAGEWPLPDAPDDDAPPPKRGRPRKS